MSSKALVSVIIPAYNHEKFVQDTILSIVNQTYENIELIVIDDGSEDSTWQKICEMKKQCEERFLRVVFETKENGGTCETLNMLIEKTEGEYIYLIASDDLAKEYAIAKEVDFLENNPEFSLVVGDNEIIDGDGKVAYWDKRTNLVYDKSKASFTSFAKQLQHARKDVNFLSENFGAYPSIFVSNYVPNGYLIRKSIFAKIGQFTKEAPLEDFWLMLQISKYAKIKYIDEILFSYRWHSANTAKQREKMKANQSKTKEYEKEILKRIDKEKCLPIVAQFLASEGYVKKRRGVKGLFEIINLYTLEGKVKIIKFLSFTLYKKSL